MPIPRSDIRKAAKPLIKAIKKKMPKVLSQGTAGVIVGVDDKTIKVPTQIKKEKPRSVNRLR